jgi:hypothetical protein
MLEERGRGRRPELDVSPIPEESRYLLAYYGDIAMGRGSSGFGPLYLTATEIWAWSQLSGQRLTPWEFRAIRLIDRVWMKCWGELNKSDE